MSSCWSSHGQLEIVGGDDRRRRQPLADLLGVVRSGEHRLRTPLDELRQPLPGAGIEPLRQDQERAAVGRKRRDDLGERPARHRQDDEVGFLERRLGERAGPHAREIDLGEVARVATRLADDRRLGRVPAGQRHLVPPRDEERCERRSPGAAADDADLHARSLPRAPTVHERRTKSMITGTPASSNCSRTRFSTQ